MKKTICLILTVLTAFCFLTAASAAGYTLPEKMERQLQVGSGLKGSFVIHSNADQELSPFVHSIRNAAYEIRGIRSGDDLHYYIYQPGEGETLSSLTEFCRIGNTGYLRSDFLPEAAYRLPDFEEFIASFLKAEGENPSILPELIRLLVKGPDPEEEEGGLDTASLEKQIELWISAFTAETTVESSENASPRLTQVFRIPAEALFNTVNVLVKTVSETPDTMEALKNVLSEDQIRTYLNPNLGYFYLEAMESLQLDGEIVFSRTMSTLGDLIQNTLTLPLDESKTGYSSIIFQNDEKRKTLSVSGAKGLFLLGLPVDFDFSAESYEEAVLQFIRIDSENREHRNIALRIELSKKHDKYEEEEETAADRMGKKPGKKSSPAECETCKNRKYQDGSNEMVSFKAAGHIAPSNAAMVVMGHEQEHVSNAYRKAELGGGEVERASVRLKTDICPECGRTYISGGETTTQIKYYNERNPYQKDMKESDAVNKYRGANVDLDQ